MTTAKLKAAAEEAAFTFGVAFALSFFGWLSGIGALPDIGAAAAALKAATVAGAVALGKAVVWSLTTKTQ